MPTKRSLPRLGLATALAPLVAVVSYGLALLSDLHHWPRDGETWLYWVLAGVAVTAYVLTFLVTAVLFVLRRKLRPRALLAFGSGGLLVGLAVALFFDLPTLNLARVEYYALAGFTGICTALTYCGILLGRVREE